MPLSLPSPRRPACLLAGMLLAAVATGCTSLFAPKSIEVPLARIEQWVAARLPYSTRLADVFDLTVAVPRLRLLPEVNRVAADVAVSLDEPLLRLAWHGSVTVAAGLRFEVSDNSVRLTNVQVERLQFDGLPPGLKNRVEQAGAMLADQLLRDRPVYTLRSQDVQAMQAYGQRPSELHVTASGLLITLVPDRPANRAPSLP